MLADKTVPRRSRPDPLTMPCGNAAELLAPLDTHFGRRLGNGPVLAASASQTPQLIRHEIAGSGSGDMDLLLKRYQVPPENAQSRW